MLVSLRGEKVKVIQWLNVTFSGVSITLLPLRDILTFVITLNKIIWKKKQYVRKISRIHLYEMCS